MTDSTAAPEGTDATATEAPDLAKLQKDLEDWKAHSRKWEERAKANSTAASELAELRKASMSDEEKRSAELQEIRDALAKAEEARVATEAKAERLEIVNEFGLSPDDAAVLEQVSGSEAIRAVAARLAANNPPAQSAPKPNPGQGRGTEGTLSAKDAAIESLGSLFN